MDMSFRSIRARIAEDSSEESSSERRQKTRHQVTLEAEVRELGAHGIEAKIINISEHGFMAVADDRFEVGCRIWLMLPGRQRANAVVKWTAGDKLGAEFTEPLALDKLGR